MATKSVKIVRKLEKPRPLRSSSEASLKISGNELSQSVKTDDILFSIIQEVDKLYSNVNNANFDVTARGNLLRMCALLKIHGLKLDAKYKEQMERYFVNLRNISREDYIDSVCRLKVLEVIELRAGNWMNIDNSATYYNGKYAEYEAYETSHHTPVALPSAVPIMPTTVLATPLQAIPNGTIQTQMADTILGPGEVMKSSGKFAKPTRIPGKNYCKDEIVIRNSDSGKVNPGAKERLVQLTGPNEESIYRAKGLVEETIRRNASPVRETSENNDNGIFRKQLSHSLSMNDASTGEFMFTVYVGQDSIRISGDNSELVQTAKLVLDEYFAGKAKIEKNHNQSFPSHKVGSASLRKSHSTGKVSKWLQNGSSKREASPLDSSDEETFKGGSSPSDEEMSSNKGSNLQLNSPDIGTEVNYGKPKGVSTPLELQLSENSSASHTKESSPTPSVTLNVDAPVFLPLSMVPKSDCPSLPSPTTVEPPIIEEEKKEEAPKTKVIYSRDFVLDCSRSHYSRIPPVNLAHIAQEVPTIVRESPGCFDPAIYRACLLRNQQAQKT